MMTTRGHDTYASSTVAHDLEWVNAIVRNIWPKASRAILLYLREFLEPAVRHNMPSYFPPVIFKSLDLGNISPVITSVSARDHNQNPYNPAHVPGVASLLSRTVSRDSVVVLELGVAFNGNTNIQMAFSSSSSPSFGIDSAHLSGRLEVIIAPVISRLPLFGAFQLAFVDAPVIDFTLTGIAAFGDMGPWTGAFRRVVQDVFGSIAVLPNRIVMRIDPTVDFFQISAMSHPVGILRVAVLEGKGFPHTDTSAIRQSLGQSPQPDVYVQLRMGNVTFRTVTIDDCESPKYDNQVFDFILTSGSADQLLHVDAFDFDLGKDDELGWTSLPARRLLEASVVDLRLKHSPMGAIPKVKIAAQFLPLSSNLADVVAALRSYRTDKCRPATCSTIMIAIAIDKARNLPGGRTSRPFVRVLLDSEQILQTWNSCDVAGLFSTENPTWEFSRHVLVRTPLDEQTKMIFEVRDETIVNGVLGKAFVRVADLLRHANCRKTYNFALMGAMRPDASLRVCVGLDAVGSRDTQPLWGTIKNI